MPVWTSEKAETGAGSAMDEEARPEIVLHEAVVEQRIVAAKENDHAIRRRHAVSSSGMGLCQPPFAAMSASAALGPQLPGL
jgi:hypothetical protein